MTRHGNLPSEAHRQIINMMSEGELKPGAPLREAELGARLSMSRTPIRETIQRIESEGLVVAQGRTVRVRRLPASDVEETFCLRQELELILARAVIGLPQARLNDMEARIVELKTVGPARRIASSHMTREG